MSPATICSDQQMESLDGRKEARKMAKSLLIARCFKVYFQALLLVFGPMIMLFQGAYVFFINCKRGLFQEKFQAPPADKAGRPSKD
jgi:hypothetical protein